MKENEEILFEIKLTDQEVCHVWEALDWFKISKHLDHDQKKWTEEILQKFEKQVGLRQ